MTKIGAKCKIVNCENMDHARGLCGKHYARWLRHGDPEKETPDRGARYKHPLYSHWNWLIRFYASKDMMSEEWKNDLWTFVKDVGGVRLENHRIARIDDEKPYGKDNFYWRKNTVVRGPDERAQRNAYAKAYRANNREKAHNSVLKRFYNITIDDYKTMLEKQNNVCALCFKEEVAIDHHSKKPRRLAVDHCHGSGKIRGLLCTECNSGLGRFKDDPIVLQRAIDYLKTHALTA